MKWQDSIIKRFKSVQPKLTPERYGRSLLVKFFELFGDYAFHRIPYILDFFRAVVEFLEKRLLFFNPFAEEKSRGFGTAGK